VSDDLGGGDMADNAKTRPKALPSANRSRLFPSPSAWCHYIAYFAPNDIVYCVSVRLRSQRSSAAGIGDRMQAEQPPTAIVGPRKATTTTASTSSGNLFGPRVLLRSSPTRELPSSMIGSCDYRRSPGALTPGSFATLRPHTLGTD
jgi:hypothetical protein